MQFTTLIISFLATAVMANPSKRNGTPPSYDACPDGLYSVAQCCATDVLGVADLNCNSPSFVASSPYTFQAGCAASGLRARCCVVPVLGQALLCETPVGVVY